MQARITFFYKKCIFCLKTPLFPLSTFLFQLFLLPLHSLMNRYTLGKIVKFFLHWHYDVRVTGEEVLRDDSVHLVMPNHSAYIDPVILFAEEWWLPMCPMSDERFVRHGVYGRFLKLADVMEVPDLTNSAMSRQEGVEVTRQLSRLAIDALAAGKQVCLYPSGHVMLVNREVIGNRRVAYEVCRELPQGARIILCRMWGLEHSWFSKLSTDWKWRRTVTIHFEDCTDEVSTWAQTLSRREFNIRLEEWYNQREQQ